MERLRYHVCIIPPCHVIFFFLLCLVNATLAVTQEIGVIQEVTEKGAVECSIFEAVYLNAIGIKSGDVVLTITTSIDTVKSKKEGGMEGVFENTEVLFRCVFDVERGLFSMIRQEGPSRRVDMADLSDQSRQTPSSYGGWAIDYPNKKLFFAGNEGNAPWRLTKDRPLQEVLSQFGFIDPRLTLSMPKVGLVENDHGSIRTICSGRYYWGKEVVDDSIKITFFAGKYDDGDSMSTWEFDLKNSLPISYSDKDWHAKHRKFYPGDKGTMEWTAVDDYDVITKMTWEKIDHLDSIDGKTYDGFRESIVNLSWIAVNKEVESRFFDGSAMKTPADIRACLRETRKVKTDSNSK